MFSQLSNEVYLALSSLQAYFSLGKLISQFDLRLGRLFDADDLLCFVLLALRILQIVVFPKDLL
jgi:hypothetical protein